MNSLQKNDISTLLDKTEYISECSIEEQQDWVMSVGQALMSTYNLEDLTVMTQNKILYNMACVWEDLSKDATYKWEWDFYKWAKAFTKRRGVEPADITIDNKITIYRDWVAQGLIEYPEEVDIPERDEAGRPTGQIIKIPFDPNLCDYSKLLVSRGTARKGEMTDQAWSLLMDPYATVRQLEVAMGLGNTPPAPPEDEIEFIEEGGIIYAKKYGHEVAILETLFENTTDPLFKEAVSAVYAKFGLKLPFEVRL